MNRAVLVLLLLAIPALSAGQSDARIVKPEIRVGDSWSYRSTNMLGPGTHEHETRVTFVDDNSILAVSTRKGDDKEFDSSWTRDWNAVRSYTGRVVRPHSGVLQFPISIGDRHERKYDMIDTRGNAIVGTVSATTSVVGWEAIDVPAGRFRAIRVDADAMIRPSDGSRAYQLKGTWWYVPEVRRWVKLQVVGPGSTISEELLSYKLNED